LCDIVILSLSQANSHIRTYIPIETQKPLHSLDWVMVTLYKLCDEIYSMIISITYIIAKKNCAIIKFLVIEKLTRNNIKWMVKWIQKTLNHLFGVINDSHIQLLHHM